ncbi:MAG: DUF5681 domain-containing protein [Proteobacteria bacterium]|nr:DUF5681 domain-containing protein [Pseudomonadota bacterium]MDA0967369.1 DUF5681 domain-containing protein [Pseudomonadota bacterium]
MAKKNKNGSNKNSNNGVFGGPPGYKNPPKSGQFKPGQSGNKKGRPKNKSKRTQDIYNDLFNKKEPIVVNGNKVYLTGKEVTLMRLKELATKGDKFAIKKVLELSEYFGESNPEIEVILPYIPSRGELAEHWKDELDEDRE